jgi:mannose-6-phosphate isomerase-like protein (cupin superfamily)
VKGGLPDIATLLATAATRPAEKYGFGEIRWLVSGTLGPGATMTVGICRIDAGKSNPLHLHPNCDEVLYVISWRCRKTVAGQSVDMGPGDCIRVPRGEPHKASATGEAPLICLIVYDTPRREVVFLEEPRASPTA